MDKRVFQIDQECFIIYAEDFSAKKEKFIRIGNSPYLKHFDESLTFITLVSSLYLGNAFKEPEIFRSNVDRKIIGLKPVVERFMSFLRAAGTDIKNVGVIYAEEANPDKKFTEEEFLEKISTNKKMQKHSFASFYSDGNIRVFNKRELIFDLKKHYNYDDENEMDILTGFFSNFYEDTYKDNGIIYSGKSIFVFSKENFACLSDSKNWTLDAIRVGIDPSKIDFLYIGDKVEPDSTWIKTFIKKSENNSKIKIILKNTENHWLKLFPKNIVTPIFPEKDTVDINIGDVRIFFQNNRINLIYDKLKLKFHGEKGFLDKGKFIYGEKIINGEKNEFNLSINHDQPDYINIQETTPLLFKNILNEEFQSENSKIYSTINENINPFNSFLTENNYEEWLEKYKQFKNEKTKISEDIGDKKVRQIEDRFDQVIKSSKYFQKERDELNAFLKKIDYKNPRLEEENKKSEEKKGFSVFGKKTVEKKNEDVSNNDFSGEEILKYDETKYKSTIDNEVNYEETEALFKGFNNKRGILRKILLIILVLLLLTGIIFGIYYIFSNLQFKPAAIKKTTQTEFLSDLKKQYKSEENIAHKKSYYYSFYMTILDNLNLTNKIAIKNGYHRILFNFEKKYIKGKDPDWIFPGNNLLLPDDTKIVVQTGDTMWGICETYLINEINKTEIEVRSLIEKTKTKEVSIKDAKSRFNQIKDETNSEMVRGFMRILLIQDDFEGWEPYK